MAKTKSATPASITYINTHKVRKLPLNFGQVIRSTVLLRDAAGIMYCDIIMLLKFLTIDFCIIGFGVDDAHSIN